MRRAVKVALMVVALTVVAAFALLPAQVEQHYNTVVPRTGRPPSARAVALHRRLTIVDLHADSLLWGRDLLASGPPAATSTCRGSSRATSRSQAFTVVTKTPRGLNLERNDDRRTSHACSPWPSAGRPGPGGACASARSTRRTAPARRRSIEGRLTFLRTRGDLDAFLERRAASRDHGRGFLGLEGAQALGAIPRPWTSSSTPATA